MSKSSYFPRFFAKRSIPGSSGTLGPCVRVTCPSSPCGYTLLWSLHLPSRIHRPPAATANTPHPLPLLLCMHPSSSLPLPPYPLTKHLDEYFFLFLFFHLISNEAGHWWPQHCCRPPACMQATPLQPPTHLTPYHSRFACTQAPLCQRPIHLQNI